MGARVVELRIPQL